MRLKAYILAADPTWIEASVLSYYELVDEIVVSYDENGRGWTGVPIAVDECLKRLKAIDLNKKLRYCPGSYARVGHHPLENDTYQRQCAFDVASEGSDWVLQIDTDEVIPHAEVFHDCLKQADLEGFTGLNFPARWLYRYLGRDRYLETCSRFWATTAGFPGPVAAKPGAKLHCARQCDARIFRVDFRSQITDPSHPKNADVHRRVKLREGIIHYSWVRKDKTLERKARWSGHSCDFDWTPELKRWKWSGRHPYLAMLMTPIMRRKHTNQVRVVRIPMPNAFVAKDLPSQ